MATTSASALRNTMALMRGVLVLMTLVAALAGCSEAAETHPGLVAGQRLRNRPCPPSA